MVARGTGAAGKTAKVGLLWPGSGPPVSPRTVSFREGLRRSGYVEGQNVADELHDVQVGQQKQMADDAADLVRAKVDVIAMFGDLTTRQPRRRRIRFQLSLSATIFLVPGSSAVCRVPAGIPLASACLPRSLARSDWNRYRRWCLDCHALLACGIFDRTFSGGDVRERCARHETEAANP